MIANSYWSKVSSSSRNVGEQIKKVNNRTFNQHDQAYSDKNIDGPQHRAALANALSHISEALQDQVSLNREVEKELSGLKRQVDSLKPGRR